MIVDSSAVIAIFLDERESDAFQDSILAADTSRLSGVGLVECVAVVSGRLGGRGDARFDKFLGSLNLIVQPITVEIAEAAKLAYRVYGRGRHPARLNFGDCFSYALAKHLDEPLLFKGEDFRKTDVIPAL